MIYVMSVDGYDRLFKVGITKNIKKRIQQLDSIFAKHSQVHIWEGASSRAMDYNLEQIIHLSLHEYRITGSEYFKCSLGVIMKSINDVVSLYERGISIEAIMSSVHLGNTNNDISHLKQKLLLTEKILFYKRYENNLAKKRLRELADLGSILNKAKCNADKREAKYETANTNKPDS